MGRMTVTIEEAAEQLGIGRNTAYQAARRGELPTIRIGRRFVVPRAELERMLKLAPEGAEHGTGGGSKKPPVENEQANALREAEEQIARLLRAKEVAR